MGVLSFKALCELWDENTNIQVYYIKLEIWHYLLRIFLLIKLG